MLDEIKGLKKVVGVKQSEKAVASGNVSAVYIAGDAHSKVTAKIQDMCRDAEIPVHTAESMDKLGHACGIDVGAAVAAILKN